MAKKKRNIISIFSRRPFEQPKNVPQFRDQQVVETLTEAKTLAELGHLQSVFVLGWNPVSQSFVSFVVDPNRADMSVPGARFSTALREIANYYMDVGELDPIDIATIGVQAPAGALDTDEGPAS